MSNTLTALFACAAILVCGCGGMINGKRAAEAAVGSNEAYARAVEDRLQPVLVPGTPRVDVEMFLAKEKLKFTYVPQEECVSIRTEQENFKTEKPHLVTCDGGGYVHVRVPVKKFINPIQTGVHVTFNFYSDGKLVEHETRVAHTGL